jgi:purine-nucleoside phosphorylase
MNPGVAELEASARFVADRLGFRPDLGIVLGSGLSAFADALGEKRALPMADIPHFPVPHVSGHPGNFCWGRLGQGQVVCLQGRVHAYEGHGLDRVVFPVRLLAELGCRAVLLTNAAGGIRDELRPGDLMLIQDHLNLTGRNPLVGPVEEGSPRFPDLSEAYDPELRTLARDAAQELNLELKEGVYAGLLGPSYETPAEIRMLRTLGADAVGMSTVLEVIALRARGVRVAAVSAITNKAAGLSERPLEHADVERTAERMRRLFVEFLTRWATLCLLGLSPAGAPRAAGAET